LISVPYLQGTEECQTQATHGFDAPFDVFLTRLPEAC